jgi:hypothetical protein
MPTYWPGGVAARKDIFGGDTLKQIDAMWTYLSEGHQARIPHGMIHEPLTITVKDEAVMLRRGIAGIIKRGIGVGYPGGVNLAFDAREMRLAAIWKGAFVDAGGVWSGQGSGSLRMMGTDKINFPKGLAFAQLKTADTPWPAYDPSIDGPNIGIQFKGYRLDKKRRPIFKYLLGKITIEDYPMDVLDSGNSKTGKSYLKRTLSFTSDSKQSNHYFRAAVDSKIEVLENNTFQVGKALRIRFSGGAAGKVRASDKKKDLIVPLDISKGKSTLVIEYLW